MDEIVDNRAIGPLDHQPARSPKRGRSVIASIGIDDYKFWPRLRNAVNDAAGVQARLVEQFGFVEAFPPLVNEHATRDAILGAVNDRLREFVREDDELIIFFAGHGHTRESLVGGRKVSDGYIVPVDAQSGTEERWSQYVAIEPFLAETAKLSARHILVILDACHSGFALGEVVKSFRGGAARYDNDLAGRVSRKVITSAMRDQLAQDGGPIAGHSLFAGTLIDGLNWGSADLDGNGFITSSELGLFLQQRVAQTSGSAQTPDFGSFHLDDRGELLLSLRNHNFDTLKARALACVQGGDLGTFKGLVHQLTALRPSSPETLYLTYRLGLLERNVDAAIEVAHRLRALDLGKGDHPLSEHDLRTLTIVLPFWRRFLVLAEGGFPLQVESVVGGGLETMAVGTVTRLGDVDVCEFGLGEAVKLRISNRTDRQLHVYAVLVDSEGRLSFPPLWDDDEVLWNGLVPGSTHDSFPFALTTLGIWEMRLYTSPSRIRYLVSAPSTPTRAILKMDAWDGLDLSQIRVGTLRYAVRPQHAGWRVRSADVAPVADQDALLRLVTRIGLESTLNPAPPHAELRRQIGALVGRNDLVHYVETATEADFIVRFVAPSKVELVDRDGKTVLSRSSSRPEETAARMVKHMSVYRALRQYRQRITSPLQEPALVASLLERRDCQGGVGALRTLPFDPTQDVPTFHSGETVVVRIQNRGDSALQVGAFLLGSDWSVHRVGDLRLEPKQEDCISIPTYPCDDDPVESTWLVKVVGSRRHEAYADFELPPLDSADGSRTDALEVPRDGWEVSEFPVRERQA